MTTKTSVRISRRQGGNHPKNDEAVRDAAFREATRFPDDIFYHRFTAGGRSYALSIQTIRHVTVEPVPERCPSDEPALDQAWWFA